MIFKSTLFNSKVCLCSNLLIRWNR